MDTLDYAGVGGSGGSYTPSSSGASSPGLGVGAYGMAASAGLSFVGQLIAASRAKAAAEYDSQVADQNATSAAMAARAEASQRLRNASIATQDILVSRQAQQWAEIGQRAQQEQLLGHARAIVGASGLMMSGSPLAQLESVAYQSERAIVAGRYKQRLEERALRDQALMEGYAATMAEYGAGERLRVGGAHGALARYEGSQRQFAGVLGAVGGLASDAAKVYGGIEQRKASAGPTLIG